MEVPIYCECGRAIPVTLNAAGTLRACSCGRKVSVPSLGELRKLAGMPAYQANAAQVIEHMLAAGELPTTKHCFHCGNEAPETLVVTVECEKSWERGPGGLGSALAILLLGGWAALALWGRERKEMGRNLFLHVPLKLCPSCARTLRRGSPGTALRRASVALALAGVGVLVILGSAWGWLLVGLAALVWLAALTTAARRRVVIEKLLRQEPLYDRLLREYPDAGLQLNAD